MNRTFKSLIFAALAAIVVAPSAQAATINMRSLETLLADTDKMPHMLGMWAGTVTQTMEYNMPFIELVAEEGDQPISAFRMTIGDENFMFSNLFENKHLTNSAHIPTTGEYALLGVSTPGIGFTTRVEDNGQELVIEFDEPLDPEETVRFQVDIDRVAGAQVSRFAPYTDVFFKVNGGDDNSGNSIITLEFLEGEDASIQLPNFEIDEDSLLGVNSPRPYSVMQREPEFPDGGGGRIRITGEIPEPGALALASLLASCLVATRRS